MKSTTPEGLSAVPPAGTASGLLRGDGGGCCCCCWICGAFVCRTMLFCCCCCANVWLCGNGCRTLLWSELCLCAGGGVGRVTACMWTEDSSWEGTCAGECACMWSGCSGCMLGRGWRDCNRVWTWLKGWISELLGIGSSSSSSRACGGCADRVPRMACDGDEGTRGWGMGWGWVSESEGWSWGEADVGMGAREDGGGCVVFRGSGAARLLGLGGCWGRALCIAVNHTTKEEEDKPLNNKSGTLHL